MSKDTNYGLEEKAENNEIPAPEFDYQPLKPKAYRPKIGLIGCGGITVNHLNAYKRDGLEVVAFCDLNADAAEKRRKEFYPKAACFKDHRELLADPAIDVVDVALHPGPRVAVIQDALEAGKHVLSQKPFALDLDIAQDLVELAESKGLKLAVNQNGRWAPYVRYMQLAIDSGILGDVHAVDIFLNWDHTWIQGTPFETIHHIILYDFAVHWIDMAVCFFGDQKALAGAGSIYHATEQTMQPAMLGNASIRFPNGFANLGFDGHSKQGARERFVITGSKGVISASGSLLKINEVVLETGDGRAVAMLEGEWFDDGFRGAMGELLCAIEEDREPFNSARNNLATLEVLFAIIGSADTGQSVEVGNHRRLDEKCRPSD